MVRLLTAAVKWFGKLGMFSARLLRAPFSAPVEWCEIARQCDQIGSLSQPLAHWRARRPGVVLELGKHVTA